MSNFLSVNGSPLPIPSALKVKEMDLVSNAERSASGYLKKTNIRTVWEVNASWNYLDQITINIILDKIKDGDVQVTFYNLKGELQTMTAYCSDRVADVYKFSDDGAKIDIKWKDFTLTFIEI